MNFKAFKELHLKEEVKEYPNNCLKKPALVTIRVLTYNHASYIARCLDSMLMQETSFDFDILIGEDESNDGTRDICIDYAKRYPDKIRLLLNSRKNNIAVNGKPSGIFNSTYSNFSIDSKYIATCEADDYWVDPTSLQKRCEYLEKNEDHVMCFHNAIWHEPGKTVDEGRSFLKFKESTSIKNEQFINLHIPTASILYRNHLIKKFDHGMTKVIVGDTLLRGKLSQFGEGRYLHDIAPSVYTVHAGGMFSGLNYEQKLRSSIEVRLYLIETIQGLTYKSAILQNISLLYLTMFFNFIQKGKRVRVTLLKKSLFYAKESNEGFRPVFKNWYTKKILKK